MSTFSASFGLLFVTPAEALLQSAEGEETPGSQSAHKSINLSQSKHKQKAQGYSRYVCGKAAGFELFFFFFLNLLIYSGNGISAHIHLQFRRM